MTLIFAHRGYGDPENTITAFQRAKSVGADGIELDTYLSNDGEWLIDHIGKNLPSTPEEVERETSLLRLLDLKQIDGMEINIELKVPVQEKSVEKLGEELIKYLMDNFAMDSIHISSFNPKAFIGIRKVNKDVRLSLLTLFSRRKTWEKWNKKVGLFSFNPYYRLFRMKHIETLHKTGIRVHPWTVNSEKFMRKLMQAGCDVLITDETELALSVRSELAIVGK